MADEHMTRGEAMATQRCVWGHGRPWPKGYDVRDEPVCGAPVAEGDCYCAGHRDVISHPSTASWDRALGIAGARSRAATPISRSDPDPLDHSEDQH